jgi:hypothetical protein
MNYRNILALLFKQYQYIFIDNGIVPEAFKDASSENAYWLAIQGQIHSETLPIDKLNRWLGFIQAVAIINKYTTVQAERDFTRPLFTKENYENN